LKEKMDTTHQTNEARVAIEPDFAWDGQDAYLFDIDGTILRDPNRIHMDSLASSVRRVTGFEVTLAGIVLHGSTDTAILREACRQAGIPDPVFEANVQAILEAMCQTVAQRRDEIHPIRMPGIEETLRHLAQRGALLGVATGNLEAIGWVKIEEAGLREWFRFGGFSDRFPDRAELVGHATRKAKDLAGEAARVCVVGDTPRDIEAAHANSLGVIAVATGHFSYDALLEYRPEVCASSLADLLAMTGTAR
jgi:phosphoglycolate phosphatase-like HAD superfamily hydrolase